MKMVKNYLKMALTVVCLIALVLLGGALGLNNFLMFLWACMSVGITSVFYMLIDTLFEFRRAS